MLSSPKSPDNTKKNFYPNPLFSGIKMPAFDNLIAHFKQQYGNNFSQMPHRHDTAFIIVQHGFLNTGPILEALLYFGVNPKHVFISTKPHTTPSRMETYLGEKFGPNYVPFWPDTNNPHQLETGDYDALSKQACKNLLRRVSACLFHPVEGNDAIKNIVICDEGGRFLSEFIKLYNNPDLAQYSRKKFSDFNVVALEHTNCGTRSLELNHLRFPYIGMAKSLAKLEFESPLIVRAMFHALDQQLPKLISRGNKDFSVIGLGNIGKQVLSYLIKKYDGINIIAYDSDATKMLWVDGQKTKLGSQWIKVVRASNLREATRASSVILGCTGENIFNHFNVEEVIGETNKTHLFSCSSGQREFKFLLEKLGITFRNASDLTSYRYSKLHKITAKLDRSNNITRKAILAEDQLLFVHNAGFPINFSRKESAGLLPEEAQLTCSLKLAAIVQALQLLQFLPSLRFHPDAKKWLEGFIKLTPQKEILSWYAQNLPEGISYTKNPNSITQQEIENYSNDSSVLMPACKALSTAHFNYFNGCLDNETLKPAPGPLLGPAIAKIIKAYKTGLSHQKNALTYYLPTEAIKRAPNDISIAKHTMELEEKKSRNEIQEEDRLYTLDEIMADYLASDEKMLLLLGEPGAGKSLFAWQQTQQLYHAQIHDVLGQRWLPVVIELKHYSLSQIEGLLTHHLTNKCGLSADELSALQGQGSYADYRLLIILEGFDELKKEPAPNVEKQFNDCVKTCLNNSGWNSEQVKVVVTCRSRHLKNDQQERSYFGHQKNHTSQSKYRRRVLLPFNQNNLETYVKNYVARKPESQSTETPLTANDYLKVIRNAPALHDLVSNPLILRLFVEALPQLHRNKPSLENIKRYDIYDAFIEQWFRRETQRLDKVIKDKIGLASAGDDALQEAENIFTSYAVLLAGEMFRKNSLEVSLQDIEHPAAVTWNNLSEKIAATINQQVTEQLSKKYRKLTALEKMMIETEGEIDISDEEKYINHYKKETRKTLLKSVMASLEAFKDTCPLQQLGELCSFIHKSLYEFFLGKGIVLSAGSEKSLEERSENTLSMLSVSDNDKERRIHHEPEILKFLEEIWVGHGHEPLFERIKETLLEIIEKSKRKSENGPAAANAITLLNWMGVMLTDKKWQEIQIPGAYLPYATLERTNFNGANLRDVEFGGDFGMHMPLGCSAVAYYPTLPWIVVGFEHNSSAGLFFTETNEEFLELEGMRQGKIISIAVCDNSGSAAFLDEASNVFHHSFNTNKSGHIPIELSNKITCIAHSPKD